jgi:hypothetical protein
MIQAALWPAIGCSMAAWAWSSLRGGRLNDREFLVFSAGLVAGQAAGSAEAFLAGSYGTAVSQFYFLVFTVWGAAERLGRARQPAGPHVVNGRPQASFAAQPRLPGPERDE